MENQSIKNQNNINENDKLVISFELLQLMDWIIEHESENLKKLISKAIKNGFDQQIKKTNSLNEQYTNDQMQNTIIDFLSLLELLLFEVNNEIQTTNLIQKNMMPAIDQIDINNCDISTLKNSIAFATSKMQRNPKENVQQLFLKELLKRWKPTKNGSLN